jgi:hypothetical protein
MAKKTRTDEVFERLHAQGLRKRTAKLMSHAPGRRRRKPTNPVQRTFDELSQFVSGVGDRLSGGPGGRKGSAKKADAKTSGSAAKKTAATRKREGQRRQAAAKNTAAARKQAGRRRQTSAKKAARTRTKAS